ncbi:MAG: hypothetical protein JJU24_09740 [Natronohydrobacter sp.]|nr:hypothetical protein [Natronohydrobacter sp.]
MDGVRLQVEDAQNDLARRLDQINKFVASGVDAIIFIMTGELGGAPDTMDLKLSDAMVSGNNSSKAFSSLPTSSVTCRASPILECGAGATHVRIAWKI